LQAGVQTLIQILGVFFIQPSRVASTEVTPRLFWISADVG
jgi:hypothetical protein